ncbi:MAG: PA2778 family cysteine peptidase [Sulfuricurvum sp.]|uniref:PA2778 family cysteine peptidase n=1 Tax=Sulfuricurvum sp. TaxID=2025608 RepID=UPI0026087D27|nr:PA2778 family cysteine peptidase [Sulfuricurvum sp.]MDD5118648.1 PA2778 family cysteine peptidase [Sulfuricurvum sp.]
MSHYYRIVLYAIVVTLMATGCVPKEPFPPEQHYASSAINVPFIPPRSELCGSTSIEMVSSYWQSTTSYIPKLTMQELDGYTLIPAKGGTLQIEMMTSARANGLIAYPMEPTFDALFAELSAHHPVIVLVNRSFSWHPLWHYAPVIGYDEEKRQIIVHFSDQPNEAVPLATFAALWKRSGNWGVVLLPPGELPALVSSKTVLRSIYEFEKAGDRLGAIRAYQSALIRWPEDTDILFALANAEFNVSNFSEAEKNYRKLLALKPSHALALNNLSMLLCRSSRSDEALKLLDKAVTDDPKIQSLIKSSREEIEAGCIALPKK